MLQPVPGSPRIWSPRRGRMCTAVLQSLQLWLSGTDCWNVISVSVRCRPVCSLIGRRGGAFAARRGAWESAFESHTRLSKRSETPYSLFLPGEDPLCVSSTLRRVLPLKEDTETPAHLAQTAGSFSNPVVPYLTLRSVSGEHCSDAQRRSVLSQLCTPTGSWLPFSFPGCPCSGPALP